MDLSKLLDVLYPTAKMYLYHSFVTFLVNHLNGIFSKTSVSSNESAANIQSSTRTEQFSEEELSDLIKDLNLSTSEVLA